MDSSITSGDMIVGTLAYAAPEQLTGAPVDARTDVYALGCVLHECLTGRPPFTADTNQALILAHLQATPPAVSSARPDLTPAMDAVVAQALAKDPARRFRSCGELAAAARRAVEHRAPFAPPRPGPPPAGNGFRPAAPPQPRVSSRPCQPTASSRCSSRPRPGPPAAVAHRRGGAGRSGGQPERHGGLPPPQRRAARSGRA
jgi:serine/threonine-protein kinase